MFKLPSNQGDCVKLILIKFVTLFGLLLEKLMTLVGRRWPMAMIIIRDKLLRVDLYKNVSHISTSKRLIDLKLTTPNSINLYRASTFSTKEPETLNWIEEFGGKGKIFFDIGANVGLYSLYYAKLHQEKVYAFECSIFNLRILGINIFENNLHDLITIMPMPLTSKISTSNFNLSSTLEGGALSTFGQDYGHNGEPLNVKFKFKTIGMTLDSLIAFGIIEHQPTLLKIDVDGIEHLILSGSKEVLRNPKLQSVLIEVNDQFEELSKQVYEILLSSGLVFREKLHSGLFDGGEYSQSFNQIWVRRNG